MYNTPSVIIIYSAGCVNYLVISQDRYSVLCTQYSVSCILPDKLNLLFQTEAYFKIIKWLKIIGLIAQGKGFRKNCNIFQDPFTTRSEGWIIRIVMRDGKKSKAKKREIFTMVVVKKKRNKQTKTKKRILAYFENPLSPDHVSNVPQHLRTEEGAGPGGVGEVTHQMLIQGGPTPYPFIHHFLRKRYPFRIASIDK